MKLYLAGPMRGFPLNNFPAFDREAARLRADGYEVVNPAELDRAAGFNEAATECTPEFLRGAIMRDLNAIAECDGIALMAGWQNSRGARCEKAFAEFLDLEIVYLELEVEV